MNRHFKIISNLLELNECFKIIFNLLGLVVQSIVSQTSLLMTHYLTVVAKVFSETVIFLLQKCGKFLHIISAKNINVFMPFLKIVLNFIKV